MVVLTDVAFDGGLQVDDAGEGASLEATARQRGEEALDGIEPGSRSRCDVERPSRVAGEPGAHLRVLVAAVVVEHHVDRLARWDCRLDGVEETDDLTVAMALHAAAEHRAFQDVEGGKQGRGAVAGVVVRLSGGMPGPERLVGTGSLQGLDLGLLILSVSKDRRWTARRRGRAVAYRDRPHPRPSRRRPGRGSA